MNKKRERFWFCERPVNEAGPDCATHWERKLIMPANKARGQNCSVLTLNVIDRKITRPRIIWLTLKQHSAIQYKNRERSTERCLQETQQITEWLQWHKLMQYRLLHLCESVVLLNPTTAPYLSQAFIRPFISHAHIPHVRNVVNWSSN